MKKYLYTLLKEKGFDTNEMIIVDDDELFGAVYMYLGDIVDFILKQDKYNQRKVRDTLVKIDFCNGDVMDYLKYIGKGLYRATITDQRI